MKTTNKSGGAMATQAHMELIINEKLNVDLGETIYYVNTGSKKSHGDVQKKTHKNPKYTAKDLQMQISFDGKVAKDAVFNEEIILNCKLIPNNIIENDPDATGEYNVDRYLDAFNKRVKPLLVCFDSLVRDEILISNPSDRKYYTRQELELTSGHPFKESDQDKLNELLIITDEELEFWNSIGVSPTYMFEDYGVEDEFSYDVKTQRTVIQ
jgi:hypothetical protein